MRRETDITGINYEVARAIGYCYLRYSRIYQNVADRRYTLIAQGAGKSETVLIVDESGLIELARHIAYAGAATAS